MPSRRAMRELLPVMSWLFSSGDPRGDHELLAVRASAIRSATRVVTQSSNLLEDSDIRRVLQSPRALRLDEVGDGRRRNRDPLNLKRRHAMSRDVTRCRASRQSTFHARVRMSMSRAARVVPQSCIAVAATTMYLARSAFNRLRTRATRVIRLGRARHCAGGPFSVPLPQRANRSAHFAANIGHRLDQRQRVPTPGREFAMCERRPRSSTHSATRRETTSRIRARTCSSGWSSAPTTITYRSASTTA